MRAIVVDALPVHTAGGSDAQELGWSLSAGVAYLRELVAAGLDLGTAAGLLEFRYAATAEQFPTIAKLRAARRLWARVTEACGAAQPQFQHAVGSPTMLTRRDPYVNLLRGTVAGFAAGVGGADAVTVQPFDAAIGAPEPFSRRIARNTQALLVDEAHLARVLDPAGGSWYVESHTDALARAAWAFFQELEAAGGAVAVLDSGLLDERIGAVRARRERDVATRATPLTGVSEFPDLDEPAVDPRRTARAAGGGLPYYRPAAPFEALRDRSDAQLAETGRRPRAFLATLGPLAAYTVRAGFARNLLQAGGVEVVEAGPTSTADEVAAAFADAGTPVAVLCSTDPIYAERAADTVAALRAAGAAVVSAGREGRAARPGRAAGRRGRCAGRDRERATRHWRCRRDDHPGLHRRPAGRRAGAVPGWPPPGVEPPPVWEIAGGHPGAAAVHRGRPGRRRLPAHLPGHRPVPARPVPDDVRHPALDHPPVRRVLHRRPSPTPSTGATWPPARRACPSRSTWPPTAATTPTTLGSAATSAWPGWPSTRSTTCASCSTASRSTRCRCR